MTTTFPTTATSPYIGTLEPVFAEAKTSVKWLIIAHNDRHLVRSLQSAICEGSAAILEVSQDTWDFDDPALVEAIEWALQHGDIKNLVLAGHSQAAGSGSRASLVASDKNEGGAPDGGYERLIAGFQQANAGNRCAQQTFATQLRRMSQIPVVHNRCADGELDVIGLFYRSEAGLFLAYETESDSFRPLMS